MRTLDIEARAGAIAVSITEIAVGTLAGIARYSYPELSRLSAVEGLFAEGCSGLQFTETGLLLLGSDVGQSFAKPADWRHSLLHVDNSEPQQRVELGPGNWTLVKGLRGKRAVLYDVSEDQGIIGVDISRGTHWSIPRTVHRIVAQGTTQVLALDETSVSIISVESGRLLDEHSLPLVAEAKWTAVAARGNEFVLGGYARDRSAWVLARWCPGAAPVITRISLTEVFTTEQIEAALCDEETCGADLFHVASISADQHGRLVLALGGDGERLGACQGACAIAVLDATSFDRLNVWVVDASDGASGMLIAEDDGIIVSCCGSVHVLPPYGEAA